MTFGDSLSLWARISQAGMSIWRYVWHSFHPVDLSAFYPHLPAGFWAGAMAWAGVGAVLVLAWSKRHKAGHLWVGVCWFLGMLVPVLGIVQVGMQSIADRYLYLPMIGLSIPVLWEAGRRLRPGAAATCLTATVAVLGWAAHTQAGYWRDSRTLFERSLQVSPRSWVAYNSLGIVEAERDPRAAARWFAGALALQPRYPDALNNLGVVLGRTGDNRGAHEAYRKALEIFPRYSMALVNRAALYVSEGQHMAAIEDLRRMPEGSRQSPLVNLIWMTAHLGALYGK